MLQYLMELHAAGNLPLQDSIAHSYICQFIYWHWLDILLAIVFLVFFGVLLSYIASKPNGIVAKLVYGLVIEAEKDLGSKTGQLKKKQVISKVYKQLPVCIRFLVNEATVDRFINEAVHFMKEALEQNNSTLASLSEESACKNLTKVSDESKYNESTEEDEEEEEAKG